MSNISYEYYSNYENLLVDNVKLVLGIVTTILLIITFCKSAKDKNGKIDFKGIKSLQDNEINKKWLTISFIFLGIAIFFPLVFTKREVESYLNEDYKLLKISSYDMKDSTIEEVNYEDYKHRVDMYKFKINKEEKIIIMKKRNEITY